MRSDNELMILQWTAGENILFLVNRFSFWWKGALSECYRFVFGMR